MLFLSAMKKKQDKQLALRPETLRHLMVSELAPVGGASGTLCQSGTPTVSSYNPTCR